MHHHLWAKPCSCVAQRILSYIGTPPKKKHGTGKHSHASMIIPRSPYILIQTFEQPYIYIYTYLIARV